MSDTPPNPPVPPAPPAPPVPPPERPDGVTDAEWAALGDPGKAAIVRERARATAAEQALAAARRPPVVLPATPPPPPPKETKPGDPPDIASLIQEGIAQAIRPILDRDAQREAAQAAETIRDTVTTAAAPLFLDPTDALAQVNLPDLTDGAGKPDQAKITAALDDLLKRKPHLGRAVDDRRRPAPGHPLGGGGAPTGSLDDRVKAQLELMKTGQ
ncbi:hypothetical protein [Iamia sp.]|uniref:hypothetical protein n=1 Tax=Iamia sp. TaxID=2722710 RepID=UPI002CB015DA|nr:hypothetical protein [Iamia sp.]HXH57733.1 hypothetical protein [Iamia sp.]